jgi:hypothetical protein
MNDFTWHNAVVGIIGVKTTYGFRSLNADVKSSISTRKSASGKAIQAAGPVKELPSTNDLAICAN